MEVIIAGCGRIGSVLAYQLYKKENTVTVIDQNNLAFENLPPDFNGRVIEGDVLDQKVLQRAGIEKADAFVAATAKDSVNAVIGHLAKTVYHISNVVVRNHEPRWKVIHDAFGLSAVGSASWGVQRLEELLYSDPLRVVYSDVDTEVKIFKFIVPENWHDHALEELFPENHSQMIVVSREGKAITPEPRLLMETGDEIFINASLDDMEALHSRLDSRQEK
jgi:trk system potassium uptake protein TrkA